MNDLLSVGFNTVNFRLLEEIGGSMFQSDLCITFNVSFAVLLEEEWLLKYRHSLQI